jgi:DNA-binding NtrC family response regulator
MSGELSVLIVDDDPGSLHLLEAILLGMRLRVTTAERPGVALRRIEERAPDLLITDLRMPEMSGVELIRAARQSHPELCCLVVTGFASAEATAEAFEAGAQDLLLKPIQLGEVQARVRHALELVELRREVARLRQALAVTAPAAGGPGRARELDALAALPGPGAPMEPGGREALQTRLERLRALYRQGLIEPAEFEARKHALLQHI